MAGDRDRSLDGAAALGGIGTVLDVRRDPVRVAEPGSRSSACRAAHGHLVN